MQSTLSPIYEDVAELRAIWLRPEERCIDDFKLIACGDQPGHKTTRPLVIVLDDGDADAKAIARYTKSFESEGVQKGNNSVFDVLVHCTSMALHVFGTLLSGIQSH